MNDKKTTYLILGQAIDLAHFPFEPGAFLIGVDRGAFLAANLGMRLDVACGDFDSVTPTEMAVIVAHSNVVERLLPMKDDTDTEHALRWAKKADRIVILGGIQGQRIEHFIAILNLLKRDSRISICDDQSRMFSLDSADTPYVINKETFNFLSVFALKTAIVSLEQVAYPLAKYTMDDSDSLGISNRFLVPTAKIWVHQGRLLVILSRSDAIPT